MQTLSPPLSLSVSLAHNPAPRASLEPDPADGWPPPAASSSSCNRLPPSICRRSAAVRKSMPAPHSVQSYVTLCTCNNAFMYSNSYIYTIVLRMCAMHLCVSSIQACHNHSYNYMSHIYYKCMSILHGEGTCKNIDRLLK